MGMKISTGSLARWSARHRRGVIWTWLAVFVVGVFLTVSYVGDALTTEANFTNKPESIRAEDLLEDRLRGERRLQEVVIVTHESLTVDDPQFREFVTGVREDISALGQDVVLQVADFYTIGAPTLVSEDRRTTLIPLVMAGDIDTAGDNIGKVHELTLEADVPEGFRVLIAGDATANEDFNTLAEEDLQRGEGIGISFALIILYIVFGALLAAIFPVVLAILAIVVALASIALLGFLFDFSFFVTNMVTMMGLAVGIDYSLFIVSRFREERARGREVEDAIAVAGNTASRAVFVSGVTVVLALVGMLLIPSTIFRSLASGAILVVTFSVVAGLTLLPALLAVAKDRVSKGRLARRRAADIDHERGLWPRLARGVMARPVISLVLAGGLLVAAALPLFSMKTGFTGLSSLPEDVQTRQAFEVLVAEFSGGQTAPVEIVIDGDVESAEVQGAVERLTGLLADDPVFGPPAPLETNPAGDLGVLSVPLSGDPNDPSAELAILRLRSEHIPQAFGGTDAQVLVGGNPGIFADFFQLTRDYTPIVFAFVLGLSFLLLLVVFRSIVVPIKAILLNLLSVGAAYGLLVFVIQQRHGASLFGFQPSPVIEAWLPLFLFSVLFGLSMDYHVFLLSRIRERYGQTGDNTDAVSFGLRSTGPIITGAALIMVAVFGGFASGSLAGLEQMGFGLAIAVLIDATIVRGVLVPASMKLLGKWNWYLPRWLQWLPHFEFEGKIPQEAARVPDKERETEPVA